MSETIQMRTESEIQQAIEEINSNNTLTYSYKEDIIAVLQWVLGREPFDGLTNKYSTTIKT